MHILFSAIISYGAVLQIVPCFRGDPVSFCVVFNGIAYVGFHSVNAAPPRLKHEAIAEVILVWVCAYPRVGAPPAEGEWCVCGGRGRFQTQKKPLKSGYHEEEGGDEEQGSM